MKKHNVKIIGFGDNVVDKYEHLKIMYPGGNCVNLCAYATMVGVEKSAYMGYFGTDGNAEHVIKVLDQIGVETIKCSQIEGPNGAAAVTVVDGERTFLGSNEGGVRGETPFVLDRFDLEYIKQFDILHSGNYCFTENELFKVKEIGVPISFDFSDDSTDEYYKSVLQYVDYAFCSFDGSLEEAKNHLKKLHLYGAKISIASRGAEGCILFDGSDYYIQAAKPVEKLVDTMGAGDSLITSFLVYYIDELKKGSDSKKAIVNSLDKASDFAAKVCGIDGAFGYGTSY